MAVVDTENKSDLRQLFQNISPYFTPEESEHVVLSLKQNYGGKFNSLGDCDLLKCFHLLEENGYVSENNLKLIEDFVALKSRGEELIKDAMKNFKASRPVKADPEKKLQGRNDEIAKINRKLASKGSAALNLFGSSGLGKTRLAKEVCSQWRGTYHVFDLREAKDMRAIYYNILHSLDLAVPVGYIELKNVVAKVQEKIRELQTKREGHGVLFMLDNVDRFTAGQGKEGKNLKTAFIQFLEKLLETKEKGSPLKLLLTSRAQLKDSKKVEDFEVKSLKRSFSEKILFPKGMNDVQPHQMDKFVNTTKGSPLFLELLDPILRQGRKSVDELIARLALTPKKSKVEEDASEKPFDFEEDGVDMGQISVVRETFDTLPTESLKVSAVVISLFHGPFSVPTAAKVLGIDQSEAIAQLEGLAASRIIFVVDEEAKERKYDIHPLLQKYADSIKSQENFLALYLEAKARFYELFMSRMKEIAKLIEPDYVRAFHLFETDRGNYEFTVDISLQPNYFSVLGEFHENTLIASLFDAMLNEKKIIKVFHNWAEKCQDDGKTGSLMRAQLKCREVKQVLDVHGTERAFEVLMTAFSSLEKVNDKTSDYFMLTKGLYLYCEGEILWRNGDFKKALECLKSSLEFFKALPEEHTDLARCYNAIGNCYSSLKLLEKALEFYNKAYMTQKKVAGSEHHFDIPIYKNQIGTVYVGLGDYKKATKCYEDALSLLKELNLLGSWDEAHFLRNLANAYIHRKEYKKATGPADRAYNIRMKILENHPLTVQSIYQRAVIQSYLNEDERSLQLLLEAWKMEKVLDAGNHSPVWRDIIVGVETSYDNLGKGNQKKGFRKEALKFCEHLWEERKGSKLFCFDDFDKEVIDTILELLSKKKGKYIVYKVEKEQFQKMYSAKKEEFQEKADQTQRILHHSASEREKVPDAKSAKGDDAEEEEEVVVELSDEEDSKPNPRDSKKIVVRRDEITDKGDTWNLPEAGAFITFSPGFLKEPLWVSCSMWSPRSLSPPIGSNELLVSNLIELSYEGPPTLESGEAATGCITMGLLHSASDFKGYEVVIKKLVDQENNEWEDLETRIMWNSAEMNPAVMDCAYAEATCSGICFTSFAVIWRLKSFVFWKTKNLSPEFTCTVPDYPNVCVSIPWNSVPDNTDFSLTLKVQEAPSTDGRVGILLGPVLHISCSHGITLLEPAKINLPLALFKGDRELLDMHSGQWRIFHFQQEWTDITDRLEMSVAITDGIVRFKVKTFCRFLPLWVVANLAGVDAGDVSDLARRSMKLRAGFLACMCRDVVPERYLLKLFCFPLHLKSKVTENMVKLNYDVIFQGDGNSTESLFNEDETSVALSKGLKVHEGGDTDNLSLTFYDDGEDQNDVFVTIEDKSNMSVDFLKRLNAEDRTDHELLCTVRIIITGSPSQDSYPSSQSFPRTTLPRKPEMIASSDITDTSQSERGTRVNPRGPDSKLKVSLLASEWSSSMGGLSTINRHLAIQLGRHAQVEVTLLVPPSSCSEEEIGLARSCNVTIREVQSRTGYDPLDFLITPPEDLEIDVVVGHGQKLGKQAQFITRSHGCKWIQVVHTSPEDLGKQKKYPKAISKGGKKKTIEVELCKQADAVVAIGPTLKETFSAYLRPCGKQQDIIELTPGIFSEFSTIKHATVDNKNFRVLIFGRSDREDFAVKGYDIASKAIAELSDPTYRLIFVGAPDGKEEEIKEYLLQNGIPDGQLTVRKFVQSKEELEELFCEVDLCIMPSRVEGFGLTAQEAMSAGLPILVSGCSGFGEALCTVLLGEEVVVSKSEDPKEWAKAIAGVRQKERLQRLREIQQIRCSYEEKYDWEKQCEILVKKMWDIRYGN